MLNNTYYIADPVSVNVAKLWFFAPLLSWQQLTWQYLTHHFPNLPHAMLFSGNAGTGKRAFVYRFIAWALCQNKLAESGCGHCESCQWLLANTHPNFMQIPSLINEEESHQKASKKQTLVDNSPAHRQSPLIKIDNIRDISTFVHHSSDGIRMVVIHQADTMTLGAGNALLKTLEEPADNVLLILISDTPSQLLPTIRSRLQRFEVSQVTTEQSLNFMQNLVPNATLANLQQVNNLSGNAPFVALDMLNSEWYQHRQTWISSWQAIRTKHRYPIQASDFWQKTLTLTDFLYLSQLMLSDVINYIMGMNTLQTDLVFDKLNPLPQLFSVYTLQKEIQHILQDRRQHIQDKLCYDKIMILMANS